MKKKTKKISVPTSGIKKPMLIALGVTVLIVVAYLVFFFNLPSGENKGAKSVSASISGENTIQNRLDGQKTVVSAPMILGNKPERGAFGVKVPNNFGMKELNPGNTKLFLTYEFSEPMDKTSVEKGLVITPFVSRSYSWLENRKLIVKFDSLAAENPLKPATLYTLDFKFGFAAGVGRKLVKTEPFTFTTGGLEFTGSFPGYSKAQALSNNSFELYFNFPVDKSSVSSSNISIYPEIKGRLTVNEILKNQIIFTAENMLPSDTSFTVTVKKDLKAEKGAAIGRESITKFYTEPLRILTTWPKNGEKNIKTGAFPYVFFNGNVMKKTFEKATVFDPPVAADFVWKADDNGVEYCIIKPKMHFNIDTEYTLNIAGSVADSYDKKIKQPCKLKFTTESCRVSSLEPFDGSVNVDPKSEIKIIFNTPMNHEETEKHISIEPKAEVVFLWRLADNYDILIIQPKKSWQRHFGYIIKVGKDAGAKSGEKLKKEFYGIVYIK